MVDIVVGVGCWVIVLLLDLFYFFLVVVSDGLISGGDVDFIVNVLLDCFLLDLLCEVFGFGNVEGMLVLVCLCGVDELGVLLYDGELVLDLYVVDWLF